MLNNPKLITPTQKTKESDSIIRLATSIIEVLKTFINKILVSTEDYVSISIKDCEYISGLFFIMKDYLESNNEIIEKDKQMAINVESLTEQRLITDILAEELKTEIDAARLLNLESISLSYKTLEAIIDVLLGLRQRIQDQDREINQLRERVNGPTGNQKKESVYPITKQHLKPLLKE